MPNLVTLVTVSDQSRKLGPFGKYQSQILNFVAKADSDMQILLRKMHQGGKIKALPWFGCVICSRWIFYN